MEPIPLEVDLDWWWYKAKRYLLKHILEDFNSNIKILEIGPGLGNNINDLVEIGILDLLETEEAFINHIISTHKSSINKIHKNLHEISEEYDLIVMLDVLEHIEDSQNFMNKLNSILKEKGSIILGVPAYQSLWSVHDEKLKHFRRYNWKKIREDCRSYEIVKKFGLNYLLLPIRFLQIKSNNVTTTNESGKIISRLLLMLITFEAKLRNIGFNPKFGISLYVVLKKRNI